MNANRCYRYTFCLAKWKEKWAQKMQNHSLTEISSKISSQLGISFQRSIQYLPLLCLEELSLDPNREKKQYIELREHFFCFFVSFSAPFHHILSTCPFLTWQTILASWVVLRPRSGLGGCFVVLSTTTKIVP